MTGNAGDISGIARVDMIILKVFPKGSRSRWVSHPMAHLLPCLYLILHLYHLPYPHHLPDQEHPRLGCLKAVHQVLR